MCISRYILPRCYYKFVLRIIEFVLRSGDQLLLRQVRSVASFFPVQSFLSLFQRCLVTGPCKLNKVASNSDHCLFNNLLYTSTRVRHIRVAVAVHTLSLKCQV